LQSRYGSLKYEFCRRTFGFWQTLGVHLTPAHYYYPIPDTRKLRPELWSKASEMVGVRMHEEEECSLLRSLSTAYGKEYNAFPRDRPEAVDTFFVNNGFFGPVDAEMYYCMVRSRKPKRILEVGSGFSSLVGARAVLANVREEPSYSCEHVAIDPFPEGALAKGFPGLTRLVRASAEEAGLPMYESLGRDDILFIDSSHVVRTGGEVLFLYLEVLPRLKPGVLVQVHDIFLPELYPRSQIVRDAYFWSEQYLVQAFLAFNESFEVVWAGNFMHMRYPSLLAEAFDSYDGVRTRPLSLWIRRVR
jgi:hypothetical protein